jgi:nucleotide-binding universal stress UspA family protein
MQERLKRRPPSTTDKPPFRHLLACLDRSASAEHVLEEAKAIADTFGARLSAVRVLPASEHRCEAIDPVEWNLTQREEIRQMRQLALDAGLSDDFETAVVSGPPAMLLCAHAHGADVDLVALGIGERRGFSRTGLGSTCRCVIEEIGRSVLLVPAARKPRGHARRILVPVDGSPQAEAAVRIAVRIASERSAELVVLHAVEGIPALSETPPDPEDEALRARIRHRYEDLARKRLERIRRLIPADSIRSRVRLLTGKEPRQALAEAIREEDGELTVVSARGLGSDPSLSIGSTADYLISRAVTPILMIREAQPPAPGLSSARTSSARFPPTIQGNA